MELLWRALHGRQTFISIHASLHWLSSTAGTAVIAFSYTLSMVTVTIESRCVQDVDFSQQTQLQHILLSMDKIVVCWDRAYTPTMLSLSLTRALYKSLYSRLVRSVTVSWEQFLEHLRVSIIMGCQEQVNAEWLLADNDLPCLPPYKQMPCNDLVAQDLPFKD